MSELKQCPCGSEAKLIYVRGESYGLHLGEKYTSIKCSCCSFSANDVEEWNTRSDGWISVEDRLPQNIRPVLVSLNCPTILISRYHPDNKEWVSYNDFVTHWMPLPNPPKTDK